MAIRYEYGKLGISQDNLPALSGNQFHILKRQELSYGKFDRQTPKIEVKSGDKCHLCNPDMYHCQRQVWLQEREELPQFQYGKL